MSSDGQLYRAAFEGRSPVGKAVPVTGHDDGAQDAVCRLVYGDGLAKRHPELAQSGAMGMLDILRSQGWALVRIDATSSRADDRG